MTKPPLRILIVDDSALFRLLVRNVLATIANCEVVGVARDGREALQKIAELNPDLVTLDIEMPEMTGIEVLRQMKQLESQAKVIMLSKFTQSNAQVSTDALLEGAFDVIGKPSAGSPAASQEYLKQELESKIEAVRDSGQMQTLIHGTLIHGTGQPESLVESPGIKHVGLDHGTVKDHFSCSAVVIGASTGGPEVLNAFFAAIDFEIDVPVIIVQHIPPVFSKSLADRLDRVANFDVLEITDGMPLDVGKAYLAPGGVHSGLTAKNHQLRFKLSEDEPENNCRPAVDFTIRSVCEHLNGQVLAMILTGMGRDGLQGCKLVKDLGGRVIAQHALGCTVFGMPKAVIEAGLADKIVPAPQLAEALYQQIHPGQAKTQ